AFTGPIRIACVELAAAPIIPMREAQLEEAEKCSSSNKTVSNPRSSASSTCSSTSPYTSAAGLSPVNSQLYNRPVRIALSPLAHGAPKMWDDFTGKEFHLPENPLSVLADEHNPRHEVLNANRLVTLNVSDHLIRRPHDEATEDLLKEWMFPDQIPAPAPGFIQ